ncbi:MAG TPA: VWA domain-containing protein [Thermoanaerobaculia bacterium]|nr:VWA domain-containing protein [Thermoanaerobaculia bacterium]
MMSARIAAAVTAAALLLPITAIAQQKKPQGEPQRLVETMDVRVINIDVVVTDRKGNVIHGLKKGDFEIVENGIPKPVSNFYEVIGDKALSTDETPAPANATTTTTPVQTQVQVDPDAMRRRIIFFIDNLSLAPFNRNRVFSQMKDFVKTVMRPGDEAMIATFNRSMKVRVPFTRDPIQLIQMLDVIAGESAMGGQNRSDRNQVQSEIRDASSFEDAVASARAYAQSVDHDLRQSSESLNALMSTLAGVEGKKILVLTSEGFPLQPGRDAFAYIDDQATQKGWQGNTALMEGMSFDATSVIQGVAKNANANGITLYTIHAGGLQVGGENSAENSRPTSMLVSTAIEQNTVDSMQLMADMTGGIASVQTNNFKLAFNNIQRDLDSYYSLGYRAANTERVDRQRALEVRLKNNPRNQYIVRARQSFVEKSTYAEMSDRVIANLLYSSKANDMHVLMRMARPIPTDDELFRVPVEVQIPMESITLLPQGEGQYVGGFDVYVVVGNKDGDMSDVARKTHQITIPKEDWEKTKGKYYTYTLDLLMEPGLNRVSIGVIDSISSVSGFAKDQIIAQDLR